MLAASLLLRVNVNICFTGQLGKHAMNEADVPHHSPSSWWSDRHIWRRDIDKVLCLTILCAGSYAKMCMEHGNYRRSLDGVDLPVGVEISQSSTVHDSHSIEFQDVPDFCH